MPVPTRLMLTWSPPRPCARHAIGLLEMNDQLPDRANAVTEKKYELDPNGTRRLEVRVLRQRRAAALAGPQITDSRR